MRIKKILVIDDDKDLAHLIQDFLKRRGYSVLTSNGSEEGLALCRKEKPDLVVLDLLMSRIEGVKFLEFMHNDPQLAATPIIIVSVVAEKGTGDENLFRLGAVDWLSKPFDFDELFRIVKDSEVISWDVGSSGAAKKIAILEDDANVAESMSHILETRGYTPVVLSAGKDLPDTIAKEAPFMVLLDILLPGKDGVDIIRALKHTASTSNIPIVVVSGLDIYEQRKRCLFAGATEYYAGTVTAETLLNELQSNIIKYEMIKVQKHAKILVADDDADLANLAMDNLRIEGFETLFAPDGEEAVRLTYQEMPDLILLDITMPKKDGYQVFRELKADILLQNIPIIMMTAKSKTREKILGLELGADDYITKPYDLDELVARVKMVLRRTNTNRELNPLTRLPGNVSIEETILDCIKKDLPFAVLYFDINDFKSYNDYYGFAKGDEVIRVTARLLLEALKENDCREDFVGHIGGDDFIIITLPEKVENLCKSALGKFDKAAPLLYEPEDRARGYIMTKDRRGNIMKFTFISAAVGVATTQCRKLTSLGEVSKIGSELKNFSKKFKDKGSYYAIDKRKD